MWVAIRGENWERNSGKSNWLKHMVKSKPYHRQQVTGAKGHFPPRVLKSEGTCNTTWSSEGDGCGVTNGCANCDNDKLGSWCMMMDDWCYCAVKKPEAAAKSGTTALTPMALTACWRFVITSQTVGALL